MGQGQFRSNCCTNQESQLNTEIDVGAQDKYYYQGRPNNMQPRGQNTFYRGPTNDVPQDLNSELLNSSQKIINYHLSNDPKAKTPTANPTNNVEHSYRIKQLAELVHYTPSLKLKVISSSSLPKGTIITINAQGVEGSFRNALDGITYFGCKKKAKRISKHVRQTEILNDYIIPAISKDIAKKT